MVKYGEPHDPEIVEPGDHPPNAERHGIWRILTISLVLAAVAMIVVWNVS